MQPEQSKIFLPLINLLQEIFDQAGDYFASPRLNDLDLELLKFGLPINIYCEFLAPHQALLLILLKLSESPNEMQTNLNREIGELLKQPLLDKTYDLLQAFSSEHLKESLHPFIYLTTFQAANALFVSAKLKIYLPPNSVSYFIAAKSWSSEDLLNLSLIIKDEDKSLVSDLILGLDTPDNPPLNATIKSFLYLLASQKLEEPIAPLILSQDSKIISFTNAIEQINSSSNRFSIATEKPKHPTNSIKTDKNPNVIFKNFINYISKQHVLATFTVFVSVAFILFFFYHSDPEMPAVPKKSMVKTQEWKEATTQTIITTRYLQADREYRMGELYLTRDMFSEALRMYKDALKIEPNHFSSLFRLAYCQTMLDDLNSATENLKLLLAKKPSFLYANLLLARVSVRSKNYEMAKRHYELEFKESVSPNIGLEYVAFLEDIGDSQAASDVVFKIQEKFPGHNILSATGYIKEPVDSRFIE